MSDHNNLSKRKNQNGVKRDILEGLLVGSITTITVVGTVLLILYVQGKFRKTGLKPMFLPILNENINVKKEIATMKKQFRRKEKLTKSTIFVGISSYRDPELCVTIEDLFKKALNPERITVGIVEQNDPSDPETCHAKNAKVDQSKLRITTIKYQDSLGPTFARSQCEKHWKGEEYYLMCDSHMKFETGWDAEVLEMLWKTKRPKRTIITWYCEGYERIVHPKTNKISYKLLSRRGWRYEQLTKPFNEEGIIHFESVTTFNTTPKIPQHVPMYSANFAFSHSDILKEVPYQDNTPHLFFGEELFMAARAYTSGWDLCGMTHSIAYHLWMRDYRKTFFQDLEKHDIRLQSVQWIKNIMTQKETHPKFSLGTKRSIQDFWNYLGVDFERQEFTRPHQPWKLPKGWETLNDEFRQNK